jgi:mono/diheme cytochrome c family protein
VANKTDTDASPESSSQDNDDPQEDAAPTAPDAEASPGEPIDFAVDIQPIFEAHCVKCHGPELHSGGLRLDMRRLAQAGGYTEAPVVGGTLETNEAYRRVSSTERAYRMPKNAEALPPGDIDKIRRWVEQGAVWPPGPGEEMDNDRRSLYERQVDRYADLFQRYEYEYAYVRPYAIGFIVAQLLLFLVARAKTANRNQRPWANGRFGNLAGRLTAGELTLVWLCMVGVLTLALMRGHQLHMDEKVANLEQINAKYESPWANTIFGYPPAPVRPDHAKQVAGTYYRGNCERDSKLFNNGNYLTATFRIHLCDAAGHVMGVGDSIPADGLYVYLEIERAPGTPDMLFDSRMMSRVFFSEEYYDFRHKEPPEEKPTPLEVVEKGQRWAARIPIRGKLQGDFLSGLIYLYMGNVRDDAVEGDVSYGIKYDLVLTDNRLDAESDLWMSAFCVPVVADPVPAGKLPFTEWFDFRPIPAITGENTKDPKLLGAQEYIDKGLLPPEAAAQPEK